MIRVALLNDYQNVGFRFAEWGRMPEGTEVVPFTEPFVSENAVVEALRNFHVVMVTALMAHWFGESGKNKDKKVE